MGGKENEERKKIQYSNTFPLSLFDADSDRRSFKRNLLPRSMCCSRPPEIIIVMAMGTVLSFCNDACTEINNHLAKKEKVISLEPVQGKMLAAVTTPAAQSLAPLLLMLLLALHPRGPPRHGLRGAVFHARQDELRRILPAGRANRSRANRNCGRICNHVGCVKRSAVAPRAILALLPMA